MMYKTGRLALALLLISLLALSCRKDGSGPSWDVDVLVPIVKTELTLKNLVADSLLASDPNGALSIAFDGTVFRLNLDTLVEIPNETIQETFILPFGTIYLQPGKFAYLPLAREIIQDIILHEYNLAQRHKCLL